MSNMLNQDAYLNPKLFDEDILNHQKTVLANGFNASVGSKLSTISPPELTLLYHICSYLSNIKNTSVDQTGFEPASSGGEPDSLPLTYWPRFTEATELLHRFKRKIKPC